MVETETTTATPAKSRSALPAIGNNHDEGTAVAVVDLSRQTFPVHPLVNATPGSRAVRQLAESIPELRSAMVLENGTVVFEYFRRRPSPSSDEEGDQQTPHKIYSVTKSWMGLIVGMMIRDGSLGLEETLGDIFTDSEAWSRSKTSRDNLNRVDPKTNNNDEDEYYEDDDLKFRKSIRVRDLLTMTSGLGCSKYPITIDATDGTEHWNDGGGNCSEALLGPPIFVDSKATNPTPKPFHYVGASNILSYIVARRSEFASPRQYLEARVFPYLGIPHSDGIEWQTNREGMELSFYGLSMTITHMAKLGQLYLQGGMSNPNHSLVDLDWVRASTVPQNSNPNYGYLWWVYPSNTAATTTTNATDNASRYNKNPIHVMFAARGLGGQDVWVCPGTDRVLVQQRDFNFARKDNDAGSARRLAEFALSTDLVFDLKPCSFK